MGLLILIAIGVVTGLLACIALRPSRRQPGELNLIVAAFGSIVAGALSHPGSVLEGITAGAMGFAICGAIVALVPFNLLAKPVSP